MEYRNIVITKPAKISILHGQLCVEQESQLLIPIEDICTLLVENNHVVFSAAALERLAVSGVTVFFCDEKHLPSAQLTMISQFNRKTKVLFEQFDVGKPLKKQIWKAVVKQKILNQARCLRLLERDGAEHMEELAMHVRSGDPDNTEAVAAAYYFPRLFGKGFTRGSDCVENAALNYGYAIIRGNIARNLVMHGLEPCIGVFHSNEYNAFNLADDLIEPYRPLVDMMVASYDWNDDVEELTTPVKRKLLMLTNKLMWQAEKNYRVITSIDRMTASYAATIQRKEMMLELPELIGLEDGGFE